MSRRGQSTAIFNENPSTRVTRAQTRKLLGGAAVAKTQRNALSALNPNKQHAALDGAKSQKGGLGGVRKPGTRRAIKQQQDVDRMSLDGIKHIAQADVAAEIEELNARDAHNPQLVTEYVNDILEHWQQVEGKRMPRPDYMDRQPDINARMRSILVDWLVEVHLKFKLKPETLHMTISVIDRFLDKREVSRTKLQLVGCTAMLLASKYEEIYAPEIRDFVYISDRAYKRDEILKMEEIIANTLSFHFTTPYSLNFAQRFLHVTEAGQRVTHMTHFLMELTMVDSRFIKYLPSTIASAAVYIARKCCGESVGWSAKLEHVSRYSESALRPVVLDLHDLMLNPNPKEKAVRKKYSSSKFGGVAKNPVPSSI